MNRSFVPLCRSLHPGWLLSVAFGCWLALAASAQAAPPMISSFSPTSGPVGSKVVIKGADFNAPFSVIFSGGAAAAGSFTSTEIDVTVPTGAQTGPITVVTGEGSASTATNFIVADSSAAPSVTLAATTPHVVAGSGADGVLTLSLSSAAAHNLNVSYKVGGSAVNGTDYAMLSGTVKVKAGKKVKEIRVVPAGDLGGAQKKVVKLTLEPGNGYTVETVAAKQVKIVAP